MLKAQVLSSDNRYMTKSGPESKHEKPKRSDEYMWKKTIKDSILPGRNVTTISPISKIMVAFLVVSIAQTLSQDIGTDKVTKVYCLQDGPSILVSGYESLST